MKKLVTRFTKFCTAINNTVRRFLKTYSKEIFLVLGMVLGWFFVTWGLAALITPKIIPLSIGIFILGLCGYKFIWEIFTVGIYVMSKRKLAK